MQAGGSVRAAHGVAPASHPTPNPCPPCPRPGSTARPTRQLWLRPLLLGGLSLHPCRPSPTPASPVPRGLACMPQTNHRSASSSRAESASDYFGNNLFVTEVSSKTVAEGTGKERRKENTYECGHGVNVQRGWPLVSQVQSNGSSLLSVLSASYAPGTVLS